MGAEVLGMFGINKLKLARGAHKDRDQGVCLMEAVAWFTDGPHTDRPSCVDPALGVFGRALNDRLLDDERQLLVGLIPALVGTSGDRDLSRRRAYLLTDRVIRQVLPSVFDVRWPEHAASMRSLLEIKDAESANRALSVCIAASAAAYAYAAYAADAAANAAAAAYAAAAAANAANAAAYAADAYAARTPLVNSIIQAFKDAIALR
jgi:hypothetical protein